MYPILKRLLDILLSLAALIALLPLLIVLGVLVKLDSPGPALFKQERVGRNEKRFYIYKLRSMNTSAPRDVATSKLQNAETHITRVGRVLRKTSLDELPQLFNVLKGEMSLIGPRPLVPNEKDIHELRRQTGAYRVRPGITGWAQVNGRDCILPPDKARLDGYYADHMSLWLDLKIIVYSVICVLTARGVREGALPYDEDVDGEKRKAKPNA